MVAQDGNAIFIFNIPCTIALEVDFYNIFHNFQFVFPLDATTQQPIL